MIQRINALIVFLRDLGLMDLKGLEGVQIIMGMFHFQPNPIAILLYIFFGPRHTFPLALNHRRAYGEKKHVLYINCSDECNQLAAWELPLIEEPPVSIFFPISIIQI